MKLRHFLPLALAGLLSAAAQSDTRRVAVLLGNNAGFGERPPLHYAEVDAGKLARVLLELGRVQPEDLFLLQGRPLSAVREVFDRARERVSLFHRLPDTRVILIFYFSGHSDGEVLEVGRDRLLFSELRRWLSDAGAEVRLAIIDSCKSGALLATKGGTPAPAFQIRLLDDLSSTGEALLTSSAADEVALESNEIRGSFFTHHLVSGLRGAADISGDGLVTLAEAYQYAFSHTVTATAGTIAGTQHPVYDYRLAGQGELVLTELTRPSAALDMPPGYDRILIVQLIRDQVIAELSSGAALRVAVPPGEYAVRAWREGKAFSGRLSVREGETRALGSEELFLISSELAQNKGGDASIASVVAVERSPSQQLGLGLAIGAQTGVADGLGALVSAHSALYFGAVRGPALMLDFALGNGKSRVGTTASGNFTEGSGMLFAGYRWGVERGRWRIYAGGEAGGGVVFQSSDDASKGTAAVGVGPWAGGSLRIAQSIWIDLECHFPVTILRRDGQTVGILLPAAWLGVVLPLN